MGKRFFIYFTLFFSMNVFVGSIFPAAAFAGDQYKLCIHSNYYTGLTSYGNPISGHASLSIEKNGSTMETYGWYPKTKTGEAGTRINFERDGTLSEGAKQRLYAEYKEEFPGSNPEVHEAKTCRVIQPKDVAKVRQLTAEYQKKNGIYSLLENNCVRYSSEIFQKVAGRIMYYEVMRPADLAIVIAGVEMMNVAAIKNGKESLSGGEPESSSANSTVSQ